MEKKAKPMEKKAKPMEVTIKKPEKRYNYLISKICIEIIFED
jgi:hypothetical protein